MIGAAKERPGLAGYQFGLADEEVETSRKPLEDLPQTDDKGKASFEVALDKVPATSRPLEAKVIVRLAEAGGRAVERNITLPIVADANMIGVKPLFSGRSLGEGENANFDVALVAPDGKMIEAKGLRYELLKIDSRYQYYRRDGRWEYEPIKSTRRIADGRIDVAPDKPGRISAPVQWGRYRLEVSSADVDGPVTSIGFDAGWYTEASADTPDMLEIALDKPEYKPGDQMTVAVTARAAGRVTLNVMGDKLLSSVTQEVTPGTARIRVPVGSDWGTGAYVVATLRRPLDAQAQRMPGRSIGVQWFSIDRKAKTLALDMKLPALQRPNTTLRVPIKIEGLALVDQARVVVAAVDVGILNLTNYKPPAPDEYYLGQRQLSAEVRDLYGQLIDGMQGTRGQIRTGGDAGAELNGSPPSQAPLALYSGIVEVRSGQAEVAFEIPAFAGTVRVMAVAWSKDKVGRASGDVIVRDPVVLTATLPRFLLTGDKSTMNLDLDNVEGAAGAYNLTVSAEGTIAVGDGGAEEPAASRQAARPRHRAAERIGCGSRDRQGCDQGAGRLRARTKLRDERQAGDAGAGAAHGEADRQGREPDAVERSVRRSRAGHRHGGGFGRRLDRARRRIPAQGARPLSLWLLGADHQPGDAAALRQRACERCPSGARRRHRPAHPRCHRSRAWRGSRRTVRSASGASAAMTPGSMPT